MPGMGERSSRASGQSLAQPKRGKNAQTLRSQDSRDFSTLGFNSSTLAHRLLNGRRRLRPFDNSEKSEAVMLNFSARTVETLVDLVENKLSYLDITDRDDRAEMKLLKRALVELQGRVTMAPQVAAAAAIHAHH